ncbi:MAG: aminotransferase class I/II-fold pyridoxal phosphate-dependent enzyme [Lachnospiraceae bacterium]|nr:aminotransferase class I/II-fold pyridoxal phosphate-dependent enzyme [Lachnospiraceae bacterium]
MLSFENDYICGAHERILQRLMETNREPLTGYGNDPYCESAKEKIRAALNCPEADIYFLSGGTQTNATVIDALLDKYEGVVAADTGHISTHEAGAIEAAGHKVLTLPQHEGRIAAAELQALLENFYQDENHEHMVFPGMVYLSHPTEYGTLYTRAELEELSAICRAHNIPLYLDGALLAKGRLLGVQFDTLFTDGLYFQISRHAIDMAELLKKGLLEKGYTFYLESPTNQQFLLLRDEEVERLKKQVAFSFWEKPDAEHTIVRFATSWSTTEEDIAQLMQIL